MSDFIYRGARKLGRQPQKSFREIMEGYGYSDEKTLERQGIVVKPKKKGEPHNKK